MADDHNPFLAPRRAARAPEALPGDRIEAPGAFGNIVWQTRAAPPTDYENALADALVACFEEGIDALGPLVRRLNEMGVEAPDGGAWTEELFERAMARLGE